MSAKVQTVTKVDNLIEKNSQSHRKSDKIQSRRAAIINSANNTSCCVFTGENIGGGTGGGGNNISTTAQQHKKNKHESEMRHFKSSRKRLQSFNGNNGKFFPPYKRRKKEGVIVPPTKFLLGGNICDPLNLNSLQDEEVNRAMNAVTPKSSPLPTPRHRKGQIEVIIPPNIYDPLNLAAGDDDAAYEAMLISPVKRSQKKQKKNKKRKHSKSISGPGSGKEDTADEARFSGDEKKSGDSEELCTSLESIKEPDETLLTELLEDENISEVQKEDKIDDKTNEQEIQENKPLITLTEDSGEPEIASAISSSATVVTPGELQTLTTNPSGPAILTTEDAAIPTQSADFESNKISVKSELNLAIESSYTNTNKISQSVSVTLSVPSTKDNQDNTSNIINVITSINPSSATSTAAANMSVNLKKIRKELKDKIVSPVIPQPGAWGDPRNHWYRSQPQRLTPQINKGQATPKFKENNTRFQYGNYNRYYGYRNANDDYDVRLKVLARRKDLFEGKDVLDIGCNVGHITLAIARDFHPNKIVGVDIDRALIGAAKRNIRHYLNPRDKNYPISMPILYGPMNVPLTSKSDDCFPHNISFIQGNYVLESDVLLTMEQPQFDTILCLSITKWFHLNWGDEGLKRAFKRMYSQLRPGGVLILEPQPWHSYKKKRNLTAQIWRNYQSIELFPHKFSQFLLSEVGFTKCEVIGAPLHLSRGFQRPIKLFTKGETIFNSNLPTFRSESKIGLKPNTVTSSAIINLNKNGEPILETVIEVDESDNIISDDRQSVSNMEIVTEKTGDKIESSSDINIVNRTPSSVIDEKTDKQCDNTGDNISNKIIDCDNENCKKQSVVDCGIPSNNDLSSDIGNDKR